MKSFAIAILGLALIATPGAAQDDGHGDNWYADFDKAAEVAKTAGKDMLVDFTGSDWCGWCIRLDKEVFAHGEFLDAATSKYVLVALDFPRSDEAKAKVPNPARNEELQKKWAVQGFPTIMLVTADGEAFGRTGYQPGGPEAYVSHLEEIATEGKAALAEAKKIVAAYAGAADDAARIAVIESALAKMVEMDSSAIGFNSFAGVARHGFELDASNEKGLAEKVLKALLKAGVVDEGIAKRAKDLDPKNEKGIYESYVMARSGAITSEEELAAAVEMIAALFEMGPIKNKDIDRDLSVNMAFWHFRFLQKPEEAKTYARRAKAIVGDDQRFKRLFDEILGDDEEEVEEEEIEDHDEDDGDDK